MIEQKTLKIPSEIRQLRRASSWVLERLSSHKLEESVAFDLRLCVEEAVRNAIIHGNSCNKNLAVTIGCRVEDGKAIIEVEDEGKGFDHKALPNPTDDKYILRNSGRGVFLIKHLMDEVIYNKYGNSVTMIKRLRG